MPPSDESPAGGEIVLFGVRVKAVDPMRKSLSMNNLSDYVPLTATADPVEKSPREVDGYASADDAVALPSGGGSDRKRGTPWTEEEHKLFLVGLEKFGKGNWRGISKNYVKTRSPTQVASHAQKYYLRRSNLNRRRRRSSLFDITTDSVASTPSEESKTCQEITAPPPVPVAAIAPPPSNVNVFSAMPFPVTMAPVLVAIQGGNPSEKAAVGQDLVMNNSSAMVVRHVPVLSLLPPSSSMANPSLNQQVPPDPSAAWLFFHQHSKMGIAT